MKLLDIIAATAAVLPSATASRFATRDNPNFPDPSIDPFYKTPTNITKYANGQIIRQRQIPTNINGNFTAAYQLLFRTNDGNDRATSTVSTVWVPTNPSKQPKIFSYQFAEDADVLDCNPSWGWVQNSASQNFALARNVEGPVVVPWGLNQGWYVVDTDAEGPDSAWIVGKMEGQAGLDGIRATINLAKLNASATTIALFGYSGAAHTSVWMSDLAAQYAPELQIVGAAFGGTPIDLKATYDTLNLGPMSALAGGALFGLANGYAGPGANPDLNATFNALLNTSGRNNATQFRSNNFCISEKTVPAANYTAMFNGPNIFTNPNVTAVLRKESLLSNVSSVLPVPVPKFPRFQYHGTNDTIVPYAPEAQYVSQQCSSGQGANIQFWSLPGLDHVPAYAAGLIGALQFVEQSLNGLTPKVNCGFPTSTPLPGVGSQAAVDLLGQSLSDFLKAALGGASFSA